MAGRLTDPARRAHPCDARPGEPWLPTDLAPIAAELVGCVRDYGPEHVDAVLGRVPDGKRHELVLVLAAMVDPDRTPVELLAWTAAGPVPAREWAPPSVGQVCCPDCGRPMRADKVRAHRGNSRCRKAAGDATDSRAA